MSFEKTKVFDAKDDDALIWEGSNGGVAGVANNPPTKNETKFRINEYFIELNLAYIIHEL